MRRSRFQQGSLQLVERKGGRKAWEYRWYVWRQLLFPVNDNHNSR